MSDLDTLLDATLDDLEDLPEFKPFPGGAHRVLASFEAKTVGIKTAIELSFKLLETMELTNPQDEPSKPGDTASTLFFLDNEYGVGNFKRCAKPFAEALAFSTNREIVEGVKEVECVIITSIKKDKNDPDKKYLNVKEIQVV